MKLELGLIHVTDLQFGDVSKVEDHVVYINQEDIKNRILEDETIESVELHIAKTGESVRITPVKDVVEPRVKVSGNGGVFPGWTHKVDRVGEGRTHVLKGMACMTIGKIVGFQEGIIDMTGE